MVLYIVLNSERKTLLPLQKCFILLSSSTNIVSLEILPQKITNPTCDQMQIKTETRSINPNKTKHVYATLFIQYSTSNKPACFSQKQKNIEEEKLYQNPFFSQKNRKTSRKFIKKRSNNIFDVICDYVCGIYYQITTHSFYLLVSSILYIQYLVYSLHKYQTTLGEIEAFAKVVGSWYTSMKQENTSQFT